MLANVADVAQVFVTFKRFVFGRDTVRGINKVGIAASTYPEVQARE